jgi:hypothetical protein
MGGRKDPGMIKAVKSAVAPSTSLNNVQVLTSPQLTEREMGPYSPLHPKNDFVPVVPRTEGDNPDDIRSQPHFGRTAGNASEISSGLGAPSVPGMGGVLFTAPPIDPHYLDPAEAVNPNGALTSPYQKVNNPPTRGMFTRFQSFRNHIALTRQDVDPNGFRIMPAQQRTSYMRNTLPPHGGGYAPETYVPRQLPQHVNTAKFPPVTGTTPYGNGPRGYGGVLNSDTYGAGQTAGGIGGNNYTPSPGPPATTSTANTSANPSGMPVWG